MDPGEIIPDNNSLICDISESLAPLPISFAETIFHNLLLHFDKRLQPEDARMSTGRGGRKRSGNAKWAYGLKLELR